MTEAALHRAVAAYLRVALKRPAMWNTFPAGGGGRVRGAQLKAMGMKPGWPDILVLRGTLRDDMQWPEIVGIELKTKTGVLSADQKEVRKEFLACGAWYAVCRSVEDVQRELDTLQFKLHARVA